jgi:AdoMet-dependent heme synthase
MRSRGEHVGSRSRHEAPGERAASARGLGPPNFSRAPFLVIWETTQACDLACKHCRAEAVPNRHPEELSAGEAKDMLDQVREFGPIIFVFSGGDCLKRPDIVELVEYGAQLGLRMAATPATTPRATPTLIERIARAGLARLAVSLDGADAATHDEFRRVPGSFQEGLRILAASKDAGLSTQVNTVIARHNLDQVEELAAVIMEAGIVFWEVFFLVPMGRARPADVASAEEFEEVFHRLYDLSTTVPFDIKAAAAPQYQRVVVQRKVAERKRGSELDVDTLTDGAHFSATDGIGRARNVNDGDGFLFVSHLGEIMPSGFLPVAAGNVRTNDLGEIYREAPIFRELRNRELLKGKCGVCEYRPLCGGSRARAHALTGDWLEAEPFCAHVPRRWERMVEAGEAEPAEDYFQRRIQTPRRSLPLLD